MSTWIGAWIKRAMAVAAVATAVSGWGGGDGLARRLPASTAAYGRLDVQRLLEQGEQFLKGTDAEHGGAIVEDVGKLWTTLMECAKAYEFQPRLLRRIGEIQVYGVLLELPSPLTVSKTVLSVNYPESMEEWEDFDPETAEPVSMVVDEQHTHCLSLVIEVPEAELAQEFFVQVRSLFERQRAKGSLADADELVAVAVDHGEMLKQKGRPATLGWTGRFLVLSDLQPEGLWPLLGAGQLPSPTLAETSLLERYAGGALPTLAQACVNLGSLVALAERGRVAATVVDPARILAGDEEDDPEAIKAAEQRLAAFRFWKKLFDLDKLRYAAVAMQGKAAAAKVELTSHLALQFADGELGPLMSNLLDGGAKFQPPTFLDIDAAVFMFRLGFGEMLAAVVAELPAEKAGAFQMATGMLKSQAGFTPEELFGLLAGDVYVTMDMVKQSRPVFESLDEATGEPRFQQMEMLAPRFAVMLGVKDRGQVEQFFAGLAQRLVEAGGPLAGLIDKRTYQGSDVLLVGTPFGTMGGAPVDPQDPGRPGRFALAVVDRFLCLGKWEEVTAAIRRSQAPETDRTGPLRELAQRHAEANLLIWASPAFNQRLQRLQNEQSADNMGILTMMIEQFFEHLPAGDQEFLPVLEATAQRLLGNLVAFNKAFFTGARQGQITVGQRRGSIYEIRQENRLE